ncbi:MAG TPA: alpha-amylase family glycosyl hydrolase, partial [Steroidobacteraceae bacterium]
CDVDPIFGTLADFDRLVERAHALNLRIIIDQVFSHTSDAHPWFRQSRADRKNPRADWYVWADAKADGSPPSNWQSLFGGPAWTWDARRGQYYLHNFLAEQPDLNVHNREVQDALLNCARFWLDRGVDGFRLDAIDFVMHDPKLTDNPPRPADGTPRTRPVDFQVMTHNKGHGDLLPFLERIRALTDQYDARFTVAEIGGADAEPFMKLYTAGERRLHTAYGFNFLIAEALTPALVRAALEAWPDDGKTGWPSWAFSNHDAPRAISRWASGANRDAVARLALLLLVSLRGNVFLYQGEELGLPQAQIAFADLKDPEAIANWPQTLGRDGARTPMPWAAHNPGAGFSTVSPWLPIPAEHMALAVQTQERDPHSLLMLTRRLIALRNTSAALRAGAIRIIEAGDSILGFERTAVREQLLCVFNLGETPQTFSAPLPGKWRVLEAVGGATPWTLPPWSGLLAMHVNGSHPAA